MTPQRLNLSTGITLDVWTAGDPAHPPILFLHGFPESHRTWRHQIAALSATHYCIAPDQRGYAGSDNPSDVAEYRRPYMAIWIADEQGNSIRQLQLLGDGRWLRNLLLLWRKFGRADDSLVDALAGATAKPGRYRIEWDGRNGQGEAREPTGRRGGGILTGETPLFLS